MQDDCDYDGRGGGNEDEDQDEGVAVYRKCLPINSEPLAVMYFRYTGCAVNHAPWWSE